MDDGKHLDSCGGCEKDRKETDWLSDKGLEAQGRREAAEKPKWQK